ncbi:MAG: cell division protein ZapA [Cytophagales bacterium]|nr:cell division protein ZapA [Cytophagales bacterium]
MKQIEVQIMGQSYLLACSNEGETTLRQAVEKVDVAMCQIRDAGKIKARDRIAVLAALNIAAQNLSPSSTPAAADSQPTPADQAHTPAPDYTSLMARLDNVLADDGQLL